MIAILILAFISFLTYRMVDSNTTTKTQVVKEDAQKVQVVTAIGRLDSDISQMYNPQFSFAKQSLAQSASDNNVYAEPATQNSLFDGRTSNGALIPQIKSEDKSSLIFFTQAHRRKVADTKESRFAWVKYSLRRMEPDPDEPDEKVTGLFELIRQTIATNVYGDTLNWDEAKPQVVMDRIKSLEFSFWDERSKKYTSSIQELNENKNLIRSLKVDLIWVDENNNEQTVIKTLRVLNPYFNTKLDDLKTGSPGSGSGNNGDSMFSQGGNSGFGPGGNIEEAQ